MMMEREDVRRWLGVGLSAVVLTYVGCSSSGPEGAAPAGPLGETAAKSAADSPHPGAPASSQGPSAAATNAEGANAADKAKGVQKGALSEGPGPKAKDADRPLAGLGRPDAVLIVSGEKEGYLEPCGCTEGQVGGLLHFADFLKRVHQGHQWPTAQIDLGGLTKNPSVARGGPEQARIKFDYSLRALQLLKYAAVALSVEDLRFGAAEALGLFLNGLGDRVKIVVANIGPDPGYDMLFRKSVVVAAGPVKIGVTAVLDPTALKKLSDVDKASIFPKVQRPEEVLPAVLSELEKASDFQVLMVQGPPALAKQLGEAHPGFDIVVATSEFIDPLNHDPTPLNGGKTFLINVGKKGKYVGAIGLYREGPERMKYQLVTLGPKFDGPAADMKALIEDEYRDALRQNGVVENFPRRSYVNGAQGATFIGAESCKTCHPKTFEKWESTRHAQAYDSLVNDPKPDTIYDAECITCHTTGFEFHSGWRSEAATPQLAGNQCENCHGPASRHVAEPDNAAFRQVMALTAEQADKNGLCIHCHDLDNSPHFKFDKYYREVSHKGLDVYNDPKVHQGARPIAPAPRALTPTPAAAPASVPTPAPAPVPKPKKP